MPGGFTAKYKPDIFDLAFLQWGHLSVCLLSMQALCPVPPKQGSNKDREQVSAYRETQPSLPQTRGRGECGEFLVKKHPGHAEALQWWSYLKIPAWRMPGANAVAVVWPVPFQGLRRPFSSGTAMSGYSADWTASRDFLHSSIFSLIEDFSLIEILLPKEILCLDAVCVYQAKALSHQKLISSRVYIALIDLIVFQILSPYQMSALCFGVFFVSLFINNKIEKDFSYLRYFYKNITQFAEVVLHEGRFRLAWLGRVEPVNYSLAFNG